MAHARRPSPQLLAKGMAVPATHFIDAQGGTSRCSSRELAKRAWLSTAVRSTYLMHQLTSYAITALPVLSRPMGPAKGLPAALQLISPTRGDAALQAGHAAQHAIGAFALP